MWRYNPVTGLITQIVLGFGIGAAAGVANLPGGQATLDFSRAANSGLIVALRRF